MNKEDLIIGIHGDAKLIGGQYNVLGSFSAGLYKAFKNLDIKTYSTFECSENGVIPSVLIGFNISGYTQWPEILKNNLTNIVWNVDAVFGQNFELFKQFQSDPKFIMFNVSPAENDSIKEFWPSLKHVYLPHAVDLDLWKKQDVKKENDLVFLSSIRDYKAELNELKNTLPKKSFDLMMIIYETWLANPNLPFWQLYQIFKKESGLTLNIDQYQYIFNTLSYIVSYNKRTTMIENLQDFDVKVYGNGPWEKYVKGKVKYMGSCDLMESIEIMNKSKICLHSHPTQLASGLHERILNAGATETFVLCNENNFIEGVFEDSMDYYKFNFEDLTKKVEYYLNNEDERQLKAKKARTIIAKDHTWDNRAKQILELLGF